MATPTDTLLGAILDKLNSISSNLTSPKNVLDMEDFCEFTGTSKRYAYRLTSENRVPHYKPNGKKIFFKREEVEEWLTQGRTSSSEEIEKKATSHIVNNGSVA